MIGTVYLVGAGCGGRELLTLRAQSLLKNCDAVIYDALIDPAILLEAPNAEKLSVGKRAGKHSAPQERINEIIIKKALEGKTVVRLKGGDPFVFGRGGEEAQALEEKGIPYEIVPGVSSCIAAPGLAGIPVTHRGLSRSFHVITAHTAEGLNGIHKYAALDGTLIFLMGLSLLGEITASLIQGGMSAGTHAAVISKAGSPEQKTVRGNLSDIAEKTAAESLEAPAVIIVGDTAGLDLSGKRLLPLAGVSVAVTGTERFADRVSAGLSALGASVYRAAVLRPIISDDTSALDKALGELNNYSRLALTSACGVDILFRRMKAIGIDIRCLTGVEIAAVGSSTAERLRSHGLIPSIVSAGSGKALARDISAAGNKGRVLILRAERGSSELTDILSESGIGYNDIRVYDVRGESVPGEVGSDFIVFGSPSGVECFFDRGSLGKNITAVCIGEVTAAAFGTHSGNRVITARESTADAIVKAILEERK